MTANARHYISRGKRLLLAGFYKLKPNKGSYILDETWDSLIILDNTRYDVFDHVAKYLPGRLEYRLSRGGWTGDFLIENFSNTDKRDDIVYVTANPFVDMYLKGKVHKIVSVWKVAWDDKYNTVMPNRVYEYALMTLRKYPNKRIIIHFLQPHQPFIMLNKFKDLDMEIIKNSIATGKEVNITYTPEPPGVLYLSTVYSYYPIHKIIKAYTENLRIVLPYVELLLYKLSGKIIITSDHGESFGSRASKILPFRLYGHGPYRIPELITVPWLVIEEDKSNLRDIVAIKKDIFKIEKTYGVHRPMARKQNEEKFRIKRAISKIKTKRKL